MALRTEQLNDPDIVPILQEVETGQQPEWKDIADRSPSYKSYCAQWKSLAVGNDILERDWESPSGRSQIAQVAIPRSRVKTCWPSSTVDRQEVIWVSAKPWMKFDKSSGFRQEAILKKWCRECDICAASRGPRTRNRGQMHQYNVRAPFERMAIDVAEPFPLSDEGNRYVLIAIDYFMKWPEAYAIPNQKASTIAQSLVTNFCRFDIPQELHSDEGRNFESCLLQEILQRLGVSKTRTSPLHP
jgi:hypothetical protein